MRRDTTAWLLVVAVLAVTLLVGCGKSEEPEQAQQQAPAVSGTPPQTPQAPRVSGTQQQVSGTTGMPMPGQMPGAAVPSGTQMPDAAAALGASAMMPTPGSPEAASTASTYKGRYEQGNLTDEELQQEHALQAVERELGYPVGP